jgi:hypothetical protein
MGTGNHLESLVLGLWTCLQLVVSAGALGAAEEPRSFHQEGISLSVPESWTRQGVEGRTVAAWISTRGERAVASLTLTASPRRTEVSEAACPLARSAVERELRASPGKDHVRILDFKRVELGGLEAYRAEVAQEARGVAIRQLLYVVAADRTFLLTFSALEEDFNSWRGEFENISSSVTAERVPGPLQTMPPWLCGSALGLFLGLAAAAKRGQKSLHFPGS